MGLIELSSISVRRPLAFLDGSDSFIACRNRGGAPIMADDDRTVMLDAIGEEPGGSHVAHQFKDVGSEEGDESTVMWTAPESAIATQAIDPQSAATVVLSPEQAAAAIANAERYAAQTAGATKSVLGGIGALLAYASIIAVFALVGTKTEGAAASSLYATGALMLLGYGLMELALFKTPGKMAKIAGGMCGLGAIGGILVILLAAGVVSWPKVLTAPWLAGICWVFVGLWAFVRGGGLGIAAGIFSVIGGAAAVVGALIPLGVISVSSVETWGMALLVGTGGTAIASILVAVIMFTRTSRHA